MWTFLIARLRVFLIIGAAALVAGCATRPDKVGVNVGVGLIKQEPAADYAALYLPYAKMASIAYTDLEFLVPSGPRQFCPDRHRLAHLNADTKPQRARNPDNLRWLIELERAGWRCIYALNDPDECPTPGCNPLPGLELHVWMKGCEAVIAIRGTDSEQEGDWKSNLRWFLLPLNLFDEYRQVEFHMRTILRKIRQNCPSAHIIATGHSLGGGLAQHAAYASGGAIPYVYRSTRLR